MRTHSSARSDDASERRGRQDQRKKTFVEQVRDRQHAARKKRADKVFDKTVKHDAAPADNAGSRAALYKGEMGSTHKKAARMQAEQGASSRVRTVKAPLKSLAGHTTRFYIALSVAACLVVGIAFLYPTARSYYSAVRDQARVQAEYDAVAQRNETLQSDIAYLSTGEGVEDRAREQYGWVKEGENSVLVSGVGDSSSSATSSNTSGITSAALAENVKAPDTWYSGTLDPLFGYEN